MERTWFSFLHTERNRERVKEGRGIGWRVRAGDTIAQGVVDIAFTVTVVMYTEHRVTQLCTGRGGAGDGGDE